MLCGFKQINASKGLDLLIFFVYVRFAVEIQPTGKVSEYTATITDETLREGKKGRHKVESLKLTVRAEGMTVRYYT